MNNEKIKSKIKLSNNSFLVILIFVILKFRNIGRSIIPSFRSLTPTLGLSRNTYESRRNLRGRVKSGA